MTDMSAARLQLDAGNYTCVLCRGRNRYTTTERGVKPLVRWLEEGLELRGFSAADKVVGKATAYLYCLLGVKAVYAHVMSISAAQVLAEHGISVECGKVVENIINRQGTGICPFEAAVLEIRDPDAAYAAIVDKMAELNIKL